MRPGRRFVLASVFLVLAFSGVSAKPKLTRTWAAPELAPIPNQKWLVLALVTEDTIKRTLEDAMVAELKKKKIDAIPAYASVTQEIGRAHV